MSNNKTLRQYFYDPDQNVFVDERGYIIFDIFRIVSPRVLLLFKMKKEYMLIRDPDGFLVELIYPDDELLELIQENEKGYLTL